MHKTGFWGISLIILSTLALFGFVGYQSSQQIDRKQLRDMLTQLGYEVSDIVKDAGKEKYSITLKTHDLNVPVGSEISPSNSFVWLTVNLGTAPTEGSPKTLDLLKQNSKIQPTFFYITDSGRLMAAMAIDNRGITNAILKSRIETVAENVGKTKDVWQK
jgi:hypothetical protein